MPKSLLILVVADNGGNKRASTYRTIDQRIECVFLEFDWQVAKRPARIRCWERLYFRAERIICTIRPNPATTMTFRCINYSFPSQDCHVSIISCSLSITLLTWIVLLGIRSLSNSAANTLFLLKKRFLYVGRSVLSCNELLFYHSNH